MSTTRNSEDIIDVCGKFCEALTREEVETFLKFTTIRDVGSKDIIADIGEVGDEFYLVIEGEVRLYQKDASGEIEVGRVKAGGLVGEMSFFDKLPRTIRLASGKQGASMIVVTRPMYKRLTIEHPYIAVNLLEFIILSLDQLVRTAGKDISTMYKTMSGVGYR